MAWDGREERRDQRAGNFPHEKDDSVSEKGRKLSDLPSPLAPAFLLVGNAQRRAHGGGVRVGCVPHQHSGLHLTQLQHGEASLSSAGPVSTHSSQKVSASDFEVVVNSVRGAEGRLTAAARPDRLSLALGFTVALPWPSVLSSSSSRSLPRPVHLSHSLYESFKAQSFSQSQITRSLRHHNALHFARTVIPNCD